MHGKAAVLTLALHTSPTPHSLGQQNLERVDAPRAVIAHTELSAAGVPVTLEGEGPARPRTT